MLKIQFKDKRQAPVWVVGKMFTIGSAADNHLVVDDSSVAPYHARLLSQHGEKLLQDTGTGETFVNGQRINQRQVACGDTIRCGTVEIEIIEPIDRHYWALIADASWLAGQEFALTPREGKSLLIGRGKHCDRVFPGTHLSREHAQVTLAGDHITITDLNSANGTYLNEKRVTGETKAVAGDRIRLDIYSFTLLGPGMPVARSAPAPLATATAMAIASSADMLPKQWKIRPTSPGNRQEQVEDAANNSALIGLSMLLLLTLLVTSGYFLVA